MKLIKGEFIQNPMKIRLHGFMNYPNTI